MTILVLGKGGVGKSSTVNSILGERVASVSAFQVDSFILCLDCLFYGFPLVLFVLISSSVQSEGLRPMMFSRSRAGFTLNIIDTPGLVEGGFVNDQALDIIKRWLFFL